MTQYSGIPSISRYVKWLLNVPVPEMVGLVYPAEVTFWIELWGLRVSVTATAISGCAACQQLHAGCNLYYLHLRSYIYLFHIALFLLSPLARNFPN